ncbi:MAG: molybdopterin-dependent oxidoreductase [Coriobacteriales bacterium]|jgi:anaerobic selenocysteine-containing dehydrogenase|nr:molybdopterin-dependent oxidoreductase [Coriobacteriales bacterium]
MAFHFKEDPAPKHQVLTDGTSVTRSCAWSPPGCHAVGCGVRLFVKDGELVKVEGDPDHPLTQGRLCPRCLALKEAVYHPDRIVYPMKRERADRGLDKWQRISWDEATELIVSKVNAIKEEHGAEAICVFMGTGREAVRYGFTLSSKVLKTPNNCYAQSGWSCMGPRQTAMTMMLGSAYIELDYGGGNLEVWDSPDFVAPDYVFCLGKEPLKSNPDGLWGHALIEIMKRGSKLIMVDPRMNWLATRADQVLQLRPNTDAALVLALLNVIISEDLYDHDFVDRWCYGFEELAERVKEYPPSLAAKACGIEEQAIYECARKLAYDGRHHWSLLMGVATDQNPNGCQVVQGLIALSAITGNLDVPGGTVVGVQMQFEMTGATDSMSEELRNKCIGWDT